MATISPRELTAYIGKDISVEASILTESVYAHTQVSAGTHRGVLADVSSRYNEWRGTETTLLFKDGTRVTCRFIDFFKVFDN